MHLLFLPELPGIRFMHPRRPPLPPKPPPAPPPRPTWSDHSDLVVSSEKIAEFIQGAAGTTGVRNMTILTLIIGLKCVIQPPVFLCPAEKIFHSFSHSGRVRMSLSLVAKTHIAKVTQPPDERSRILDVFTSLIPAGENHSAQSCHVKQPDWT